MQFPSRYANKRGKMTQPNPSPNSFMQQSERKSLRTRSPTGKSPSGGMSRWPCKDYLKGTCTNSFCDKWHPPECLFYKTKSGCRFGKKCSYAHRLVDEQPSKRSKKNDDKSAVAMLKKNDLHDEHGNLLRTATKVTIEWDNPLYSVTPVMSQITDLFSADHRIHGNWVVSFRTWSRRS